MDVLMNGFQFDAVMDIGRPESPAETLLLCVVVLAAIILAFVIVFTVLRLKSEEKKMEEKKQNVAKADKGEDLVIEDLDKDA